MATQKYFVLPAEYCNEAIQLYQVARDDAVDAKKVLLAKFGANALVTSGSQVEALAWMEEPIALSGFTIPRRDARLGAWLQKPKLNTIKGKAAAREMDEVGELLEIWQWALEKALGIHGCFLGWHKGSRMFLNAVAKPLADGRVVLCIPVRDHLEGPDSAKDTDPKIPQNAVEISKDEAEKLMAEPELEAA